MAELYDGRTKTLKDKDLIFWNTGDPSISSTLCSYSNTIDLGNAQYFGQRPAVVVLRATANFSTFSSVSAHADHLVSAMKCFEVQDAADGSTFSTIALLKAPISGLQVNAEALNASAIGIVSCRRYVRLRWAWAIGGAVSLQAWLRMGLSE